MEMNGTLELERLTMDSRYQDMIHNNFLELIEKTENIDLLIDELVESQTISKDKADRIMGYDEEDRASVLYNLLPKCGPDAFNNLLKAFFLTGNEAAALILKDNRLCNQSTSGSASPVGSQESDNEYEEKYRVKTHPRGIVLLINIFKYDNIRLKDRFGSQHDTKNLKELFECMGYAVQEEHGGTKQAIEDAIYKWKDQHLMTSVDSGIIIIMAHGKEGIYTPGTVWISTSDEKIVESEWIIENMSSVNAPRLHGKPKLIFILTCRGEIPDYGSDTDKLSAFISLHPRSIPTASLSNDNVQFEGYAPASPSLGDVLLVYPCAPGRASSRDENLGSWFVQEMCKVFREKAHTDDVETMLKEMDRNLAKQRQQGFRNYFQVICTTSRGFKRKFFLNPTKTFTNGNS